MQQVLTIHTRKAFAPAAGTMCFLPHLLPPRGKMLDRIIVCLGSLALVFALAPAAPTPGAEPMTAPVTAPAAVVPARSSANSDTAATPAGIAADDLAHVQAFIARDMRSVLPAEAGSREGAAGYRAQTPSGLEISFRVEGGFRVLPAPVPDTGTNSGSDKASNATPTWQWGLRPQAVGIGNRLAILGLPLSQRTYADTLTNAYAVPWLLQKELPGGLVEWFANGSRGLRQTFTLAARPHGPADGPLVLQLAQTGDLQAAPAADGRSLIVRAADGQAVLTYAGLHVFDATGRSLPAQFRLDAQLAIEVADAGEIYPLVIDPLLGTAANPAWSAIGEGTNNRFGWPVAAAGDVNGDGYADRASAPVATAPVRASRCLLRQRLRPQRHRRHARLERGGENQGDQFGIPWPRPATSTATATPTLSSAPPVTAAAGAGLRLPWLRRRPTGTLPAGLDRRGRKHGPASAIRRRGGRRQRRRLRRSRRRLHQLRQQHRQGLCLSRPAAGLTAPRQPRLERRRPEHVGQIRLCRGHGRRRQRRRLRRRHRRRRSLQHRHGQGLRLPRPAAGLTGDAASPAWTQPAKTRPSSATLWPRRATSTATATPTSSSPAPYYDNGTDERRRCLSTAAPAASPARQLARLERTGAMHAIAQFGDSVAGGRRQRRRLRRRHRRAPYYDNGETDEGAAFVYLGSATGLGRHARLDRRERPGRRLLRLLGAHGGRRQRRRLRRRHRRRSLLRQRPDRRGARPSSTSAGRRPGAAPAWTAESDQASAVLRLRPWPRRAT